MVKWVWGGGGSGLVIAPGVEDWDPGSAVSWKQGWPGAEAVGSDLARLQSVKLGQSWKFVIYALGIKAGMEGADSKHWMNE